MKGGGSRFRIIREILGLFESALMGCFLSCFRTKEDARRKSSSSGDSIVSEERVSLVPKKDVATDSFFQSKGKDAHATAVKFGDDRIPKDCKIEEISNEVFIQTFEEDGSPSNFPSEPQRLHDDMNNNLNEQSGPAHDQNKLDNNSEQAENNFQGCIFEEQRVIKKVLLLNENNYTPQVDWEQDSANMDISPSPYYTTQENRSPFPTPLNLIDEMQTPGTVYPVNSGNSKMVGKSTIRTEYVYPLLKSVENLPQWFFLGQDRSPNAQSDDTFEQQLKTPRTGNSERGDKGLLGAENFINSRLPSPSSNRNHDASSISTNKSVCMDSPSDLVPLFGCSDPVNIEPETPRLTIASSSKCLKPQALNYEKEEDICISNQQYLPHELNFHADRPIIGTVPAHWLDADSPKRWDGHGIPNSTTKYKEDQKVSWHATPFEERLEKVLSDEKHLPQRKFYIENQ